MDFDDLLRDFKKVYNLNLIQNLQNVGLKEEGFSRILQDLYYEINTTPIKGNLITSNPPFYVNKMRYKDDTRNIGSSSAYRLLCMINDDAAIPFHLYHKISGKKPKTKLTEKEKTNCKKMVNDAATQSKGGKSDV